MKINLLRNCSSGHSLVYFYNVDIGHCKYNIVNKYTFNLEHDKNKVFY
jgi:hypothetical protein